MPLTLAIKRSLFGLLLLSLAVVGNAFNLAHANEIDWKPLKKGTATWLWIDIYEGQLFTETGKAPAGFLKDGFPLKLELCYLREITAEQFIEGAEAGLPENLSAPLQKAVDELHSTYETVQKGDCYQLEYTTAQGTQLKRNGNTVYASKQAGFKAVYFGIWLGQDPLSDELKNTLLSEL